MASAVPEENSSFPNVRIYIQNICKKGTSGDVFKISLSEGSFFLARQSFIDQHKLSLKLSLDEELYLSLKNEDEYLACLNYSLNLISFRENSSGGLKLKLLKKGFGRDSIDQVVLLLVNKNFIDDTRFSQMWIHQRLQKNPEGVLLLKQHLMQRGVPSEVASAVIGQLDDSAIEVAVSRAAEKCSRGKNISEEKLKRSLYRKGFALREINQYLINVRKGLT